MKPYHNPITAYVITSLFRALQTHIPLYHILLRELVKTGTRRIIEFFLAPLLQHGQESLREK
jgi:hypothetical protein